MGLRLCLEDPVVTELRTVFRANVLRIPEIRIRPLAVLLTFKAGVHFLGDVRTLLDRPFSDTEDTFLLESGMAVLENRRTRKVDGKLGGEIMSGFVQGMTEGRVPGAAAALGNARTVQFSFPHISRQYVEIAQLGRLLAGHKFARQTLLLPSLQDPRAIVRIVDSVITCSEFEMHFDAGDESTLSADTGALAGDLASARATLTRTGAHGLKMRSEKRLTFAFTCVNVAVDMDGTLRAIAPSADAVGSPRMADGSASQWGEPAHVVLSRFPELIDLQE
ncbi:MAG: hypothetical protein JWP22_3966 [Ramlibacter sp.]|nr:hypothetical protein [Ramlibacter sp.]